MFGPTIRWPSGSTSSATPEPPPWSTLAGSTPPFLRPEQRMGADPPAAPRHYGPPRGRTEPRRTPRGARTAGRRRWGRQDQEAIAAARARVDLAEAHLQRANEAEHTLREQLDAISQYQEHRQQAIAALAPSGRARQHPGSARRRARPHPPRSDPHLAHQPDSDLVDRLGRPRRRPRAEPYGATTPSPSRPSSTVTTAPHRPRPSTDRRPAPAKTSPSPTGASTRPATRPIQPCGPNSPNRPPPSETSCTATPGSRQPLTTGSLKPGEEQHRLRIDNVVAPPGPELSL